MPEMFTTPLAPFCSLSRSSLVLSLSALSFVNYFAERIIFCAWLSASVAWIAGSHEPCCWFDLKFWFVFIIVVSIRLGFLNRLSCWVNCNLRCSFIIEYGKSAARKLLLLPPPLKLQLQPYLINVAQGKSLSSGRGNHSTKTFPCPLYAPLSDALLLPNVRLPVFTVLCFN